MSRETRIIHVTNCRKCPYRSGVFGWAVSECHKYDKDIPPLKKDQMFPDFCKLKEVDHE